jgi:hypothetical protein
MAKGPGSTAEVIKGGLSAVKDTTNRGNEMQNRQVTALNRVNNSLDRMVMLAEQNFMLTAREAIGGGKKGGDWANALEEYRKFSAGKSMEDNMTTNANESKSMEQTGLEQRRIGAFDLAKSTEVIPNAAGVLAEKIVGAGKDLISAGKGAGSGVKDAAAQRELREGMAESQRAAIRGGMQTAPITMRSQVPTDPEKTMKHEVAVAPLDIRIQVESPDGMAVKTTTNRPDNTSVQVVNNAIHSGGIITHNR